MTERICSVLHALNQIEVRGSSNLNLLLACIQEMEKMKRDMEAMAHD